MIQVPLTKLLFFDIETVGLHKDYDGLEQNHPALTKQFNNYFDWFQKRFPGALPKLVLPLMQMAITRSLLVQLYFFSQMLPLLIAVGMHSKLEYSIMRVIKL